MCDETYNKLYVVENLNIYIILVILKILQVVVYQLYVMQKAAAWAAAFSFLKTKPEP